MEFTHAVHQKEERNLFVFAWRKKALVDKHVLIAYT